MKSHRIIRIAAVLTALMVLAVFLAGPAFAGKRARKSKEHEAACNNWCAENKPDCSHCSPSRGCGAGYDTIKSWTGYGKNWYACKKRMSRDEASKARLDECTAWCDRNPDCEYCSRYGCGDAFERMRKWKGRGKDVEACSKRQFRDEASNRNRDSCLKWCEENKQICNTCKTSKGCGPTGDVAVKSWTGKGRNFYACGYKSQVKKKNKADCDAWCKANPGCVKCDTKKGCGTGLKRMKSFSLGGSKVDYHACKKR